MGVEGDEVRSTESTESWRPEVATHLDDTVHPVIL